jgi:hypothetical protein
VLVLRKCIPRTDWNNQRSNSYYYYFDTEDKVRRMHKEFFLKTLDIRQKQICTFHEGMSNNVS